jgi:cytochrome c oxidase cbb3-type subunit 3
MRVRMWVAVAACAASLALPLRAQAQGGAGRGAASSAVDAAQSRNMSPAAIERGAELFAARCASCHGANARGGSTTKTSVDLIRSPMVLDDLGTDGREISDFLKYGRPEKNMPKFDLTEEQGRDIAAWLHRQISTAAERGAYKRPNVFSGDPVKGEAFFNGSAGRCNTCHSATGDMKGLAARYNDDASTIQAAIVSGTTGFGRGGGNRPGGGRGGSPAATATTATVTLKSGEIVKGYPYSVDDWQITIRLASGDLRSFLRDGDWPHYETVNPLQAHIDLQFQYTDDDIHDLAAYLRTLK